jgi:choline dehydrogenase
VHYDVVVVGGGTAGCILAARLSEAPERTVCLLEAGPDYGPWEAGRWPAEMVDARALPFTHDWGRGGEDDRSLGARILGGSSAHNACAVVRGTPADYDEWGPGWTSAELEPYLARARAALRTAPANTDRPAPFHAALLAAAQSAGMPVLADPDDPATPVGVAPFPANAVDGVRWNASFAYLDPARGRANLTVAGHSLVDRVILDGTRATGVTTADGDRVDADLVVLSAGAYLTPAILLRSGIGPEAELARHGVRRIAVLPVGERLLDHCGTGIAWSATDRLNAETARHEEAGPMFEPHVLVKAASPSCPPGSWDIHLLSFVQHEAGTVGYELSCGAFHMKPGSYGRVALQSTDPGALPLVERGFLSDPADLDVIVSAIELARRIAETEPLRSLLGEERRPGPVPVEEFVRSTVRSYFHPAGTCAIGAVVDRDGSVLGIDGLVVADASIMPTIPRANTNLTTAAIAERLAETLGSGRAPA